MPRSSNMLVCSSPSCDLGGEENKKKKTKKQLGEIHKDWSKRYEQRRWLISSSLLFLLTICAPLEHVVAGKR